MGSRLEDSVDVTIPIAARNYDVALMIAEVILRGHAALRLPEPEVPLWTSTVYSDWPAHVS